MEKYLGKKINVDDDVDNTLYFILYTLSVADDPSSETDCSTNGIKAWLIIHSVSV